MGLIKVIMYDSKPYDIESFNTVLEKINEEENKISFTYLETKLNKHTAILAKGYDIVCVFVNDTVDKDVIDILYENNIKVIALKCSGYNNVDVEYCFNKIHVLRVPSYSPNAVAEHTFAMLLTSIRRIHKAYIRTKDNNFSLSGLVGEDLYNKTIGIIGTGKIGKCMINIAKGFGMNIKAYDKFIDPNLDVNYCSLEEIYKTCDIISLHCPLTNENRHMINKNTIDMMKKGVIILNTSRGGLINSNDLLEGIKSRKIGAACLDVYEEESDIFFTDKSGHILNDDTLARLITMPNVILTSHQAYLTKEALNNIANTTIENILNYQSVSTSQNEICYHCGNIENCKKNKKLKCF